MRAPHAAVRSCHRPRCRPCLHVSAAKRVLPRDARASPGYLVAVRRQHGVHPWATRLTHGRATDRPKPWRR